MSGPVRQRRRPGYITLHRDALRDLAERLGPATLGILVMLVAEADFATGDIRSSVRALAVELGLRRATLVDHLARLEDAGELRVTPGPNQHAGGAISIVRWAEIIGLAGTETGPASMNGGPVGGPVSVPPTVPADRLSPAAMGPLELRDPSTRPKNETNISPNPQEELEEHPLFEAMLELIGQRPATRSERRGWARACEEIREAGGRPDQVRAFDQAWMAAFGDATLTPAAVARHWGRLREDVDYFAESVAP